MGLEIKRAVVTSSPKDNKNIYSMGKSSSFIKCHLRIPQIQQKKN
jgi:hypothetical protein